MLKLNVEHLLDRLALEPEYEELVRELGVEAALSRLPELARVRGLFITRKEIEVYMEDYGQGSSPLHSTQSNWKAWDWPAI